MAYRNYRLRDYFDVIPSSVRYNYRTVKTRESEVQTTLEEVYSSEKARTRANYTIIIPALKFFTEFLPRLFERFAARAQLFLHQKNKQVELSLAKTGLKILIGILACFRNIFKLTRWIGERITSPIRSYSEGAEYGFVESGRSRLAAHGMKYLSLVVSMLAFTVIAMLLSPAFSFLAVKFGLNTGWIGSVLTALSTSPFIVNLGHMMMTGLSGIGISLSTGAAELGSVILLGLSALFASSLVSNIGLEIARSSGIVKLYVGERDEDTLYFPIIKKPQSTSYFPIGSNAQRTFSKKTRAAPGAIIDFRSENQVPTFAQDTVTYQPVASVSSSSSSEQRPAARRAPHR